MIATLRRISSITLLAVIVIASTIGCETIRELTYPKDFTYIEDKEVEALMRRMGQSVGKLDQLVAEAKPSDTEQQQKIIAELNKLEAIATRLSGDHTQTNQFVIGDHIEGFMSDLGNAKMFASMTPPRYDRVNYVTNECAKCHQFR